MRLAVYTDYQYHRAGGYVYAERAFAVFLARLGSRFERFTVIGRLAQDADRGRYALGEQVEFVPLPYYPSLSEPLPVLKGLAGSIRQYWKALGDVDCVWLLGPHPVAFPFAAIARLRRKRVVLGVRQDLPEYVRNRHPGRKMLRLSALVLELAFRALGRFCSVVAVGPTLAHHYRHSRRLLQLTVSLVDESDIVAPESKRLDYRGELKVLSVGRLDPEKNPLMLADVLARLVEGDPRWRLIVCGDGSLTDQLDARLRELGVDRNAEIRGYVPQDGGLSTLYSESQMLLHVSWTEGLPQVLYEAFAAGLPVVATDVGGVRKATAGAATLVPAGDPAAAAQALQELSEDESLRRHRIEAGHALVSAATIDVECRRVAEFLTGL
jgi:glycosyltransferase involved in cell wall biosynthesis